MKVQLPGLIRLRQAIVLTMTLTVLPSLAGPVSIFVASVSGDLNGAKITDAGKTIGLVGDYVSLAEGDHALSVGVMREYRLVMHLRVDSGSAAIVDYAAQPGNCAQVFAVAWDPPRLVSNAKKKPRVKKGVKKVIAIAPLPLRLWIASPQFGAEARKAGCFERMSLSCPEDYARVRFTSAPPGAEIWIEEERQDSVTPVTLSVPFCQGRPSKHFMLRRAGLLTCPQDVDLTNGAVVNVQCNLADPSAVGTD